MLDHKIVISKHKSINHKSQNNFLHQEMFQALCQTAGDNLSVSYWSRKSEAENAVRPLLWGPNRALLQGLSLGWLFQLHRVWHGLKQQGLPRRWKQSRATYFITLPAPRQDPGGWARRRAYSSQLCTCTIRVLSYTTSKALPALLGSRTSLVLDQFKNSHIYSQIEMKIVALLMTIGTFKLEMQ